MVPPGTLSRYAGVLLDMNGTFMFGGDRFGPEQDYAATYRALGGRQLAAGVVQGTITACFETMGAIYDDPARCDSFPQLLDTLRDLPAARHLPEGELKLLERVIAEHELGRVSDTYALALKRLAATHRLGLVANILSPKDLWLDEFARAGVLNLFATLVFSSLRCDIGGAAAAGLATVWIDRTGRGRQTGDPEPTFVVRNLLELVDA